MKISFFSEMQYTGKTPRLDENLRMPQSWLASLNADHYPINKIHEASDDYDIGIIIIPKDNLKHFVDYPVVSEMKKKCKKIGFQQEGPSWYYQDYEINLQMWFYNAMTQMDFALAHSEVDRSYYETLLDIPTYIQPTLIVDDSLSIKSKQSTEDRVIIGGNFVRWYGGFDSYITALNFETDIWAPSMGKRASDELDADGINHLPYMGWVDWMNSLSTFKYAVHLNPNTIAGSFNLNCAYWGIPCIGNIKADTQRLCFPKLSVDVQDLKTAKELAIKLREDKDFYDEVSNDALSNYNKYFKEDIYLKIMDGIFREITNG